LRGEANSHALPAAAPARAQSDVFEGLGQHVPGLDAASSGFNAHIPDPAGASCEAIWRGGTLQGPLATWRSGYAAACKAVYTGSIPVVASE
jgi:hypothetical protein